MARILNTYSGSDLNLSIVNPLTGTIQASGVASEGIAQVIVRMTVDQSVLQVGMDGAVVPSVVPGEQGEIEIQVWQTSTLQDDFIAWADAIKAAQQGAGDVSNWFAGTIFIQNIVNGSSHTGTGAAPKKIPDKTYDVQAGRVSWVFTCCNIVNT